MHGRTALTLALGVVFATLLVCGEASATDYQVTTMVDSNSGVCPDDGVNRCTLRAAISRANQDTTTDKITVPAGTLHLTVGELPTIGTNMTIVGAGAGATRIEADVKGFRVMSVATVQAITTATLSGLTLADGRALTATGGPGGNLLVTSATVTLDHVRLTGGIGIDGGGLAMRGGHVTLDHSLVDTNKTQQQTQGSEGFGAGIYMSENAAGAAAVPTQLTLTDSTVTGNTAAASGGGIYVVGSVTQNSTTVTRSTVANNAGIGNGGGIFVADAEPFSLGSSIVAANKGTNLRTGSITDSNCSGAVTSQGANVVSTADCVLAAANDVQGVDPGLGALAADGGQTPVLPISATSPAVDRAGACAGTDQRDVLRPQGAACDSGAYELIPAQPAPSPGPTPTPQPTPTPPAPVFHKTVVIKPVSGKVKVKLRGSNKFVTLTSADDIPLGSTIDVKAGKLQLSSVPKAGGTPQTATFYGGIFKVTQPGGTTDLKLTEALASCARRAHASAAAKRKPKTRRLWGQGSGAFRTTGKYSAATVRGTKWLVQDSCSGTLTRVTQGVVRVRDQVRHKTIVVRAGHRYVARPRRR